MEELGPLMNQTVDYPDQAKGGALDKKIQRSERSADGSKSPDQSSSDPSDSNRGTGS